MEFMIALVNIIWPKRNKRYFFEVCGLPPTMSLSGGSPLDASRFLHGNDELLHIISASSYPPYGLC